MGIKFILLPEIIVYQPESKMSLVFHYIGMSGRAAFNNSSD